jgi:site-specific DNA-methyltransferase (cytosine-N4-specific)
MTKKSSTATAAAQGGSTADFAAAEWDFASSRSNRELHPYPARFIPEIPGQALDILNLDGPILDPFCGSGTTLAEARRRGLPSTGIDINPIACLISRVRTQRWQPSHAEFALRHSRELLAAAKAGGDVVAADRRIPRLNHWFDSWAQAALAGAVEYLDTVTEPIWRDRIAVAISSAVVRISRQESDTRYAAIAKAGDQESAALELAQAVVRVCDWLAANTLDYKDAQTRVLCCDAQSVDTLEPYSFAGAIFSPPYPNAYEYWLYHKYRMYWLGFEPVSVRTAEIGARPHYCKPNGLTEVDFARQMSAVFGTLRQVLQPEAPAVVVVGDSVVRGQLVDNGRLVIDAAAAHGFTLSAWCRRNIRTGRSSFNRAHSRGRRDEHVLLLRSPRGTHSTPGASKN